jgi:hypothetical protein
MNQTLRIRSGSVPALRGGFARSWWLAAFGSFFVAALLGCALRYFWIGDIGWISYRYVLHAHSHLALLGWGFTLVSGGLLTMLPAGGQAGASPYRRILALNVVAAVGMTIAFALQGYGLYSITFSTVHLLSAYLFAYYFLADLRRLPPSTDRQLARWAVWWMIISTLGLFAIAPVAALLGKLHPLYYASIQFFLHFQFNGWLTFGALALLLGWLRGRGRPVTFPATVFVGLQVSLLLTYALSVSWSTPLVVVFVLNSLGVLLQLAVFTWIGRQLYAALAPLKLAPGVSGLLWVGLASLAAKILIQSAVAIPALAEVALTVRNFVIGFIHLTALGSISLTVIALLMAAGYLPATRVALTGYAILVAAFLTTEFLLFGQGLLLWLGLGYQPFYYESLFGSSLLFPLGLGCVLFALAGWRASPRIHSTTY